MQIRFGWAATIAALAILSMMFASVQRATAQHAGDEQAKIDLGKSTFAEKCSHCHGPNMMNSGTWTISLSTSANNWNTLSSTFSQNLGGDNTQVFKGNLSQSWAFGDILTINLSTPFLYDPSKGNLLMTVDAEGTSDPAGGIYFDTNGYNNGGFDGNTFLGRVYCNGCGQTTGTVNNGYGLVTGFITSGGGGQTPEPSSLLLMSTGLVGMVGFLRRKMNR